MLLMIDTVSKASSLSQISRTSKCIFTLVSANVDGESSEFGSWPTLLDRQTSIFLEAGVIFCPSALTSQVERDSVFPVGAWRDTIPWNAHKGMARAPPARWGKNKALITENSFLRLGHRESRFIHQNGKIFLVQTHFPSNLSQLRGLNSAIKVPLYSFSQVKYI